MAVKDLIQHYEPPAESARTPRNTSTVNPEPSPGQAQTSLSNGQQFTKDGGVIDSPPRLARFIKHNARAVDDPFLDSTPSSSSLHLRSSAVSTIVSTTLTNNTTNITPHNEQDELPDQLYPSNGSLTRFTSTISSQSKHSKNALNHSSQALAPLDNSEKQELLMENTYPPRSSQFHEHDTTPRSPQRYPKRPHPLSHKPVAATVVFARNAFPLSLPKLDRYLSSLLPPFLGDDGEAKGGMFPPMNQLAKTGLSLDDLENNSTVAPTWRNPTSILHSSTNLFISLLGSSALASFYSLTGLFNTIQIFALILSTIVPVGGIHLEDTWRKLFLGTIPNILALNFAPVVIESLIFLFILMTIAAGLLYYFYRATIQCDRYTSIEGLQQEETKGRQWGLMIATFLLIVLYLPLCTMSVHVLVWSQDLWPIANPYVNATVLPPVLPPLGPATEFRDPLDFCWTTTMKRNEVNIAPLVVALATIVFFFFAIWFPIALRRVIQRSVPKVDKFSELGRPRSRVDLDGEYSRLLDRDKNPFAFLYNAFRRGWATYISTYLFAKLSTLVIIAVIDPDNCFFRSFSRTTIPMVRQTLLLFSTLGFFIAQCIFNPFMDPVNNASEWTSRLNYLSTSITALLVTLDIPQQFKDILDSYVLYCIYIITYGLGFYFSVITFGWMQNIVKKLTRRIDFSIDIFSPRLDISPSSIHTKRRIWQESITVLLLTDPDCTIPKKQPMAYAQARDSEFPPYLLNFMGSPGERHVENLKIFREVGSVSYQRAVALVTGPDFTIYQYLEDLIQKNFVGPDSYWKPLGGSTIRGCTSHFGNAWWIPFPPTLVIRYDDGPYAVLRDIIELETYIAQNSSRDIERRRYVRTSLRALEGRLVRWPYEHVQPVGSHANWWCCGKRYNAVTSTHYEHAVLSIKRRGHLQWHGLHLGSGFDIEMKYARDVKLSGEILGLNEDFDLTSSVARFLEYNKELIDEGLFVIEEKLSQYRRHHRKEFRWKSRVLSYRFLTFVYDMPRDPDGLVQSAIDACERDSRVCGLMARSEGVLRSAYTRLTAVSTSEAATWWYVFWDDLWRRNHDTIAGLEKYASDFNPHYRTSIAYTPLPRAALETFLVQRGLLHKKPRWRDFFHAGFLNKLYLRLNDAAFRDSGKAIMFHFGSDRREMDMEEIDILTQGQSSTLGTGGGTDYDESEIRMRPAYRWEGLLSDAPHTGRHMGYHELLGKLGAWLGVTPLWRVGVPSNGISLDVKLKNGRYVLSDVWSASADDSTTNGPSSSSI